ncbi:MAG: serine hydrolase [Planctomycetes bacterium]|nr:serine hydrolase [Planctomycetota bacterium]
MQALLAIVISALALLAPRARAQDVLETRAKQAAGLIAAEPAWPDDLFDKAFLKQVPAEQLRAIGKDFFGKTGALVELQLAQRKSEWSGVYDMILAKEQVVPLTITVSEKAPHSIIGLYFGVPAPAMKDVAAVVEPLRKLPGKVSFAAWRLGGEKPEVLAELAPDEPLAIGSAFKLYVLGALAKEVGEKQRTLADVVTLDTRRRSLPSGQMHAWPIGTPVTLASLASMMISISDNTATDHLLFALGRERVEGLLGTMGNAHAERSIPFLATNELFRLKMTRGAQGADEYLKLDLAKQRAFLEKDVASWPLDETSVDSGSFTSPNRIDTLEWFASASDLCRAMDWLRKNTESGPAAAVREVLTISRGLDVSKELFPWCGFKGGSEPGVINLTFLLKSKDGAWFAVAATWNDVKDPIDETRFAGLLQRALYALGKTAGKK